MIDHKELHGLIKKAREHGAIVRIWWDGVPDGIIKKVMIRRAPGPDKPIKKAGAPGAMWMAPISAAERLRADMAAISAI